MTKVENEDIVSIITNDHPVLNFGDICRVRFIHDTHIEVIRGEDDRHTSVAMDKVIIL